MEINECKLLGPKASSFFNNQWFVIGGNFGNWGLEALLRCISITRDDNGNPTLNRVKVATGSHRGFTQGEPFINANSGQELILYKITGGELPSVTESGYESLDTPPYPVAPFLSKCSETKVYVNQQAKKAVVFVKRPSERWINSFCSVLFRILPWRFKEELSEADKSLYRAYSVGDMCKVAKLLDDKVAHIDFDAIILSLKLSGWNKRIRDISVRRLENDRRSVENSISNYEAEVDSLRTRLQNIIMQQNCLANSAVADGNDDELYRFFYNHKQLNIINTGVSSEDITLKYSITETLEYFDKDQFERLTNNRHSYFYDFSDRVQKFFKLIFDDERGKIRVESVFLLKNLSSLRPISGYSTGDAYSLNLPNPHLYHFACLGGNENYIQKYMRDGNWDMAIEQSIAATKNVNFGDSAVISRMASDISSHFDTCSCVLVDGVSKSMTPQEFLEYIEKQDAKNESDNQENNSAEE